MPFVVFSKKEDNIAEGQVKKMPLTLLASRKKEDNRDSD